MFWRLMLAAFLALWGVLHLVTLAPTAGQVVVVIAALAALAAAVLVIMDK